MGGHRLELSIGRYPDISLADARGIATIKRAEIMQGRNPAADKQKAKATAAKDWTVRELVKDYRAKKLVSPAGSTQVSYGRHLKRIENRLGAITVREIEASDVIALIEAGSLKLNTRMTRLMPPDALLLKFRRGWRYWLIWLFCIAAIGFFGALRAATGAEYAFASLVLIPVLLIAWIGGRAGGIAIAVVAAAMWGVADLASDRQFGAPWIPWANAITRLITYGVVAVLAAQVRLLFERERDTATQDALTGIPNRRAFLQVGTSEIERLKRYGHPLSIVFLDLDNFKQLNDSKGHDAGDDALRATAEALLKALRSSDHVARLGGDEFAALLPEIGYGAAVEAGRKISYTLHETLRNYPPVRVSIGVAWFERVDQSIDDLLKVADQLMYEVRMSGKGDVRVQRFPPQAEDGHLAAPQVSQLNLAIRAPVNGRLEKT